MLIAALPCLIPGRCVGIELAEFACDRQLARYPIIVRGWWPAAPVVVHEAMTFTDGVGAIPLREFRTMLVVDRVLRGRVSPGTHHVILGEGVAWRLQRHDGSDHDPSRPGLWFLAQGQSRDRNDRTEFLNVNEGICIQPPELEEYFLALSDGVPDEAVIKRFCGSRRSAILRRVLHLAYKLASVVRPEGSPHRSLCLATAGGAWGQTLISPTLISPRR